MAELIVEADGPLGVRCETCGASIAGTQYPTVTFRVRTLVQLAKIHEPECTPKVAP
jgi:hypothetical protein